MISPLVACQKLMPGFEIRGDEDGDRYTVHWQEAPWRFHIWISRDPIMGGPISIGDTIYKNPIEKGGSYRTIRMNPGAACHAPKIEALRAYLTHAVLNSIAKAAIAKREEQERHARAARAERYRRGLENFRDRLPPLGESQRTDNIRAGINTLITACDHDDLIALFYQLAAGENHAERI